MAVKRRGRAARQFDLSSALYFVGRLEVPLSANPWVEVEVAADLVAASVVLVLKVAGAIAGCALVVYLLYRAVSFARKAGAQVPGTAAIMRTLLRGLILGPLVILAIACLTGVAYERISRINAAASTVTPTGTLECRGQGSPVVLIFATGYVPTAQPWPTVQPAIEEFTTVCSRTGVDLHQPLTGERMVNELHEVLRTADISPPYVLVGWSAGGLVTRWFDDRYPGEAAGFVFVDSSHPDTPDRPRPPIAVPPWSVPLFLETGVLRALATDRLPAWLSRRLLTRPRQKEAVTAYLVFSAILRESRRASAAPLALGSRPTVVLTSEGMPRSWMNFQEDLALLSSNSAQAVVKGASHEIHVDKPEAVIGAIRDVVAAVRTGESLAKVPIQ